MRSFDYIIAGAGASGLTLTYLLLGIKDAKKSILIIDKDLKAQNDRTWCFWEKEANLFEQLVHKRWPKALIKGSQFEQTYALAPYEYKMIRGIDFYNHLIPQIKAAAQVEWVQDDVVSIEPSGIVHTEKGQFQGQLVFNSTIDYQKLNFDKANNVLQHFKGWLIETEEPTFEPDKVTYMDFSVDQEGDCRFGYILPISETKGLVEYTLFNKTLLDEESYSSRLSAYIDRLGIARYRVLEEETGVIPMTDHAFKIRVSDHVFNIGILGGFAKASTGYSFLRAQHILQKMAVNIATDQPPDQALPYQKKRFKTYDATLLDVLTNGKFTGEDIFINLFEKNGAHLVFKFLDEETHLAEEIKLMSTTPIVDFGLSFVKQLSK